MNRKVNDLYFDIAKEKQKTIDLINGLNRVLEKIDHYVLEDTINIENHIYDNSIWNDLGMHYLKAGFPNLATKVYNYMLTTIRKYDKAKNTKLYKGLAFHNLGVAYYADSRLKEARLNFMWAYDEDASKFGKEAAEKRRSEIQNQLGITLEKPA